MPSVRESLLSEKFTKQAVRERKYPEFTDFHLCDFFFDESLFFLNNVFHNPIFQLREKEFTNYITDSITFDSIYF